MGKLLISFINIGLLSIIFLVFQNCSGQNSIQLDTNNKTNTSDVLYSYNYKCEFKLKNATGNEWEVEWYSVDDDDCIAAKRIVNLNNPGVTIKFIREVLIGYDPKSEYENYYYKCSFRLRGQADYEWSEERFSAVDDDCDSSTQIIRSNYPDAVIIANSQSILGYDQTPNNKTYLFICKFKLKDVDNSQWTIERYTYTNDDCTSSYDNVKNNNPNSTILFTVQVSLGYN